MRRKSNKGTILFIIAIMIMLDFSLNDSKVLTKFTEAFTNVSASVGHEIGEWIVAATMNNK